MKRDFSCVESLDELEKMVTSLFSVIENKKVVMKEYDQPWRPEIPTKKICHVPLTDFDYIGMYFQIPPVEKLYKTAVSFLNDDYRF